MKPLLIPSGTSDRPKTTANGANDNFNKFENNFISLVVKLFFLLNSMKMMTWRKKWSQWKNASGQNSGSPSFLINNVILNDLIICDTENHGKALALLIFRIKPPKWPDIRLQWPNGLWKISPGLFGPKDVGRNMTSRLGLIKNHMERT